MLVLSRKEGEKIRIGDVLITVVNTGSNKVRIGIEAPPDVPITRVEKEDGADKPAPTTSAP